jgi:sugar lactone lactonase YvrE
MIKNRTALIALASLASLALVACDKSNNSGTSASQAPAAQPTTTTNSATTNAPAVGTMATAAAPAAEAAKPAVAFKGVGLETPESVLYDDATDTYLVSNINGQPTAVDGNGFIAQLSPEGQVKTLKWIEGGKNKATLNAPKGLGLTKDALWVADLDTVRVFDRKTGAPKGEVKVPGATFLNDVAVSPDGTRVFVSDSGLKAGAKGFDPTGTDAVYAIDATTKKLATVAKSKDLGAPNGLLVSADGAKVWTATFGTNELFSLDAKTTKGDAKKADVTKLPKGSLDGIVALPSGDLLVSSWDSSTIYRGKPGGEFKAVVENVKSPADIGFDTKRSRVLVPHFTESTVEAYDVK